MRKIVFTRLETATAALAEITRGLAAKETERNKALIDGAEANEIAKFDEAIATIKQTERTERDRIALLEVEAAKEKAKQAERMMSGHISRFAKLQEARVALAKKIECDVEQLWKDIRSLTELSERARTGYAVRSQSAVVGADSVDGAAMSHIAIAELLRFEFYRQSWTPYRGGREGERTPRALPGAKCPRFDLQLQPEKIIPFSEKIRIAANYAVQTLRAEIKVSGEVPRPADVPAVVNGGEPRPRTDAEAKLAELLVQQAAAAEDITPQGEERYKKILAAIVATTAEIQAWQTPATSEEIV